MKPKPGHELAGWQLKRLPTAALSSPQPSGLDATPQAPAHSGARLVPPPVWRELLIPTLSLQRVHPLQPEPVSALELLASGPPCIGSSLIHLVISSLSPPRLLNHLMQWGWCLHLGYPRCTGGRGSVFLGLSHPSLRNGQMHLNASR